MNKITKRLREIVKRVNELPPGPWNVGHAAEGLHHILCPSNYGRSCHNIFGGTNGDSEYDVTGPCAGLSIENATFIAHSRLDVPYLLRLLKRTAEIIRSQKTTIKELEGIVGDMRYDGSAYALGVEDGINKALAALDEVDREKSWHDQTSTMPEALNEMLTVLSTVRRQRVLAKLRKPATQKVSMETRVEEKPNDDV